MDFHATNSHLESDQQLQAPHVEHVRRVPRRDDDDPHELLPYEIVLSGAPFRLNLVEYRLICLLASRPYYPFTPPQIISGVNRDDDLISEESLAEHIRRLRDKLGFFHDYVQKVPFIGYRFKP